MRKTDAYVWLMSVPTVRHKANTGLGIGNCVVRSGGTMTRLLVRTNGSVDQNSYRRFQLYYSHDISSECRGRNGRPL